MRSRSELCQSIKEAIRNYPDYPVPGVIFRDIMPLFSNLPLLTECVEAISEEMIGEYPMMEAIAVPEARGFLLGTLIAYRLRKPLIPIRKAGKLPGEVLSHTYNLEYGTATLEISRRALESFDHPAKVVVFDDVIATGETINACYEMIRALGGHPLGSYCLVDINIATVPNNQSLMHY